MIPTRVASSETNPERIRVRTRRNRQLEADVGLDLDEFGDELGGAAAAVGGEYDGNGIALDGTLVELFFYGPDADQLYAAVEPILGRVPVGPASLAVKRYGEADEPGIREERVDLSEAD